MIYIKTGCGHTLEIPENAYGDTPTFAIDRSLCRRLPGPAGRHNLRQRVRGQPRLRRARRGRLVVRHRNVREMPHRDGRPGRSRKGRPGPGRLRRAAERGQLAHKLGPMQRRDPGLPPGRAWPGLPGVPAHLRVAPAHQLLQGATAMKKPTLVECQEHGTGPWCKGLGTRMGPPTRQAGPGSDTGRGQPPHPEGAQAGISRQQLRPGRGKRPRRPGNPPRPLRLGTPGHGTPGTGSNSREGPQGRPG